tara:strand:- start:1182 stop:1979 length:798 start_codon:yes stop_codon:yes gene_type:complete
VEFVTCECTDFSFPEHVHEGYTIGRVIAGREVFSARGCDEAAGRGTLYFVHPDEAHSGRSVEQGSWRYHSLYLTGEALSGLCGVPAAAMLRFRQSVMDDEHVSCIVASLFDRLEQGDDLDAAEALVELAALVRGANSDAAPPPSYQARDAVERAHRFIREASCEPLALDDIAREARLNPTYLIGAFRERHGLTPHAYLVACRVLEARRQLAEGASIAEAALASGFCDQSHLNRHFRRLTGMTPGGYARAIGIEPAAQSAPAPAHG